MNLSGISPNSRRFLLQNLLIPKNLGGSAEFASAAEWVMDLNRPGQDYVSGIVQQVKTGVGKNVKAP